MDELPIILVVEDEWHLKEFVKDALTDAGFDMTASPSAEEAITVFRSGAVKYRALVTDIQLKGEMSSWELARNVREIERALLPMNGRRSVPNSILLEKPFASAQLVTAVSQLMNIDRNPPTKV